MNIKKTYGVPCEHDNCTSKDTYSLSLSNSTNWLCEKHMEELIDNIKKEFKQKVKEMENK